MSCETFAKKEATGHLGDGWVKLRAGTERCFYCPDFLAVGADGKVEFHEVKGRYVRDDSRVKFQAARMTYPFFRWVWAQKTKAGWKIAVDGVRVRSEVPWLIASPVS